jgi:hypothetical protein
MSATAPPAFADQFWEHVGPQLSRLCTAEARCVAADVDTFGNAVSVVVHHAWKYGAGYLPPERWDAVHDWILTTLGAEIFRAEMDGWSSWLEDNHIRGGRVP